MVSSNIDTGTAVVVLVLLTIFVALMGVGVAQADQEAGGSEEPLVTGVPAVLLFVAGGALLIFSAEKFIGYLVRAAEGLGVSLFLLAIVLTGIEFDDAVLGVATNLEELSGVALGSALGTALSLTGVTLALAAIVKPFRVSLPDDYVLLFALSPLALVPFALTGTLTAAHGAVLLGVFVVALGYIVYRETSGEVPIFRETEVREVQDGGNVRAMSAELPFVPDWNFPGWAWLGMSLLALAGLVVGAESMAIATEGIVASWELEGTVFGATIATAVLTFEDVFLTVEPVRRGAPEIGVGNVVGSVIFSVTGNVGVVLLVGSISVSPSVLVWHLPMLVLSTGLAAYFIWKNELRRWHGYVLLALYAVYWVGSYLLFGGLAMDL
ncbi:sodium:calcium antiporter [Halorussus halophilus]|uniref:sodium:calcium antiporter n=1 Tax=Halorussus halophilus TaxID=2650975 RepID=UPI0013011ADF|nr:sodium:proton exchanger [Halorussus halophilus]